MTPTLVLLTGPPATGKSSLADAAAAALDAPVLGWDWAMAGLTRFEALQKAMRGMDQPSYRSVGWSVLWNLATAQLRRGSTVVLDGVARAPEMARTREVAAAEGASVLVVATSCTDLRSTAPGSKGVVGGSPVGTS